MSKLWLSSKKKSLKWLNEIESIYNNYQIYDLANGNEQVIFTSNGPVRRSEKLVEYLLGKLSLTNNGKLLDYGCGNGSAIKSFSNRLCGWEFDGVEVDNKYEKNLRKLKTLKNFIKLKKTLLMTNMIL